MDIQYLVKMGWGSLEGIREISAVERVVSRTPAEGTPAVITPLLEGDQGAVDQLVQLRVVL